MKLKSPNGSQTLAVCTDMLWVQSRIDPNNPLSDAERIAAVERAVDAIKLQREGPVTIRPLNDRIIELRLKVAYGPVYGGCRQDLERSADSVELRLEDVSHFNCAKAGTGVPSDDLVTAIAGRGLRDDFVRRTLTLADLKAHIDVLTARTNDATTLTASARENAERRLAQCRIYLAQHAKPISLVDGEPQPAKPSEQLQPEHDERPRPSTISPQEICFGPSPAQQAPQPVDSNRVEDARNPSPDDHAPDSIDNSLIEKELGADHEQEPEEALPEAGRPAGGDDAYNDVFRSSRHEGRERRDADD
jgi:hypothetical protein